jgi:hypothetical protein
MALLNKSALFQRARHVSFSELDSHGDADTCSAQLSVLRNLQGAQQEERIAGYLLIMQLLVRGSTLNHTLPG